MTDAVFQRDSYLQQLDAVVTALDAEFVELINDFMLVVASPAILAG